MAKISTYPIISTPSINDLLIGTDVDNLNITKNFSIGDIASFIIGGSYVPYTGATTNVNLGTFNITSSGFIVNSGTAAQFLKANGTLDSTVYQPAGNYITQLSGEATASGPGNAAVTLSNSAVIGKVLTGLTITGNAIVSTDSILTAFGKVQNQINTLVGGVQYKGTWNAATNTPALVSSVGVSGNYYVVSVAGNTNLNGITDWNLGDWAIFNGSAWEKVDNTDAVISVNGQVGAVVLTTTNISEGTNLYYTDTRARLAINLTTTGNSGAATYNNTNGFFNIPNYTLAGLGGVPSTRELTINGTTFDLSANRTWNVGTVTSVGTSAPLTGGTITGSGTIGITQAGVATDGYLSSIDWNTFNNKQNTITNPVTGTGTAFFLPMWSSASSLVNSPLSYLSDTFTFQYNSPTGGTVVFTNSGLTAYAYTIQMNNFGSPRSTVHSYTDGIVVQSIAGFQVSRVFANGNTVFGTGVADNGHKLELSGSLFVNTIANATIDTDRFLVSDSGVIKYRTGTELLSDIGAGVGSVTSVGLTMPSAFSVANSPITSSGTIAVTGAGIASQYIRGDGTLADFPTSTGGGSSVSYYLNASISQGTIGGVAYKQLSEVPIFGAGTDISIAANGYVASFLTDAGDPNLLNIPAGNWNFETYFSSSSAGGTPSFYVELYRYDGTTFTLIASSVGVPELISLGTAIQPYFSTLAVPQTALALTDRLAIRYYVNVSGRTITLHTENGHLCQVVTTFSNGLTALNGLTAQIQYFQVGTSGTDFAISSASATHTFNLPDASASARGVVTTGAQTIAGNKTTTQNIDVNGVMVGRGSSGGNAFNGIAGNTAVGTQALLSITTGYPNTAIGSEALRNITTGANNIAIGEEAGKIDSGSGAANATSSTSIYIGNDTKPQTNGNTNEIVIGHGSEGNGSNTVTIGNSSTTLNKFFGTTLSDAFRLPSDGGGNQVTIIENIGTIHEGTASINKIGFNSSNNIYFGKGLSNGGVIQFTNAAVRYYTLPDADGTIALTSNLSAYLPLAGGTMTGAIVGTTSTFTNSGAGIGVGVTNSGSGDGVKITHSAGRAFNIQSSGAGFGVIINNETASTSAPFTIQKQGTNKVAFTDAGAADFSSSVTASSFVKSSGTSAQFLKADGSVDSSTYLTTGTAASTYLPLAGGTLTGALNGTSATFSGNISIAGAGLSPWGATFGVMQSFYGSYFGGTSGGGTVIGNNNYFDGTNYKYINSDFAGQIQIGSGNILLRVAPSGTGGNNVTYTNALTLASTGAATFSSSVTATQGTFTIPLETPASGNTALTARTSNGVNDVFRWFDGATQLGVFKNSGNVGIGTASPAGKLEVKQTGSEVPFIIDSSSDANAAFTQYQVNNNNGWETGMSNAADGYKYLFSWGAFGTANAKLAITSTGNVGIGTASPKGKFDVFRAAGDSGTAAIVISNGEGGGGRNWSLNTEVVTAGDFAICQSTTNGGTPSPTGANTKFYITSSGNSVIGGTTAGTSLNTSVTVNNPTAGNYSGLIAMTADTQRGYYGGTSTGLEIGVAGSGFLGIYTSGTEKMRITSGGELLIGATSNSATSDDGSKFVSNGRLFQVSAYSDNTQESLSMYSTTASAYRFYVGWGGTIFATNTTISGISDARLKENVRDLDAGLDKIMALKPRVFDWKEGKGKDIKNDRGFIAQEFQEVFPDLIDEYKQEVEEGQEPYKSVRADLIPVLVKAIQELKTEIDSLKNQIK